MPKKNQTITTLEEIEVTEITFFLEPARMVFEAGGKKFAFPRDQACFLFGRHVENRFAKIDQTDSDYSEIDTLENILTWQHLKDLNYPNGEIAKEIGISPGRLLSWVNKRHSAFTKRIKQEPVLTEKILTELKKKYPESEEERGPEIPKLNTRTVAKAYLKAGRDLNGTAEALSLPRAAFMLFWNKNLKEINRLVVSIQASTNR